MNEGQVVKAYIMQADGKYKNRPVVLIKKLPYFDDWLVCGISSKIHTAHQGLDIVITQAHSDFMETELDYNFVIRTGWLYVFPESKIKEILGKISLETLKILYANLANFILKK